MQAKGHDHKIFLGYYKVKLPKEVITKYIHSLSIATACSQVSRSYDFKPKRVELLPVLQ